MAFIAPALFPSLHRSVSTSRCPTMGPWKPGEKDEAYRQQQEILARRRNKGANREYFQQVNRRREEREDKLMERRLVVRNGEDPLIPWKRLKEKGFIDEAGYGEEDEGGIPIPMASFGIPKYDNGGRFDLKLPHVEIGYTDEDADVMKKAGNAIKNLFGGIADKKQKKQEDK